MKKSSIKSKTIYQDQRIAEEFCNFRCDYCEGFCPSGYSLAKDSKGNLKVADDWYEKIKLLPIKVSSYFKNGTRMEDFYNLSLEVMNETKNVLYADILKVSGGEVTTNKKLVDFIRLIHKNYLSIQILTNGFSLTEDDIKEYKKMKNVSFQVSIDGVTAESNYAKSHNAKITEKVLANIECMVKERIGVEINCVLTKYNTDKILDFLERFKDADNFIIIPRPVRGEPKETLNFSKIQISNFENMMNNNFEKYSKILPPKKYIDRLIEIMKEDKRNTSCYIPFFVQSIDGYGNLEQCPIGLITETNYNIFDSLIETPMEYTRLVKAKIFNDNSLCKNCTNQYEMFNLYVEGKISKEELRKMPSLNSDVIIGHIDEIKEELIQKELKIKLEEKYNLKIDKLEKNEQSTDGNVYIVYVKNDKYVVKIYNNIEHTKSMVKLHKQLSLSNLNIPKVILSKEQKDYEKLIENNYFVVYSFLEGQQIGWNAQTGKLEYKTISLIAKMLRRIHLITEGNNEFDLKNMPFESNQERKSVVHFDLTRNNIFISDDNLIGIIDFDDAKYGESVCDIAILIANLFFSKTRGVDIDGMQKFIDEYYYNEQELKCKEVPLIKKCALQWIDYILEGNEFDTSTTESFEVRRNLIEEKL